VDAVGAPTALVVTAATLGTVHTLLGPDHYVPFVALARSRAWSLRRTWAVTAICGVGHVLGSIVLGVLGIGLGWALGSLIDVETARGPIAGWLLLGFGLAYTAWGVRRGLRNRSHSHLHAHVDGTLHVHPHGHLGEHAHPHDADARAAGVARQPLLRRWLGPWTLFVVFVLGPCEPLIPVLLYPAAAHDWGAVVLVAVVFSVATIATMLAVVTAGAIGLAHVPARRFERWSHAAAGIAIAGCGLAVVLGL